MFIFPLRELKQRRFERFLIFCIFTSCCVGVESYFRKLFLVMEIVPKATSAFVSVLSSKIYETKRKYMYKFKSRKFPKTYIGGSNQ